MVGGIDAAIDEGGGEGRAPPYCHLAAVVALFEGDADVAGLPFCGVAGGGYDGVFYLIDVLGLEEQELVEGGGDSVDYHCG